MSSDHEKVRKGVQKSFPWLARDRQEGEKERTGIQILGAVPTAQGVSLSSLQEHTERRRSHRKSIRVDLWSLKIIQRRS